MGVWVTRCSLLITILAMITISMHGEPVLVTLQSAKGENSDQNVEFDVADLVQNIETPYGEAELHAFKSTKNDEIMREAGVPRYSQLIWVSFGNPTFVTQNKTESNSGRGLFLESDNGFYGRIQMLTSKHRAILAAKAKFRYKVNVEESQIVNLILSTFECSLHLYDQTGNKFLVKGTVTNFLNFPLRMDFSVPPNSLERKLFASVLQRPFIDHVFQCKMASKGKKTLANTLKITSRMSEQIGLESKLFGPVQNTSGQVFVTREQSATLARELYSALDIMEDYDMPEHQFEEAFIQDLINQAAAQVFQLQPIDTVLASISKYGTNDISADLKPDVIKRDLGSILKIEKYGNTSRIIHDETKVKKVDDKWAVSGGFSVGASFVGISVSTSVNFAKENSHSEYTNDKTLDDQLRELNAASQNDVKWEIEGERVVPKSLNVALLIRSRFSQTLEFSRVRVRHEEAAFVRDMGLSTLRAEKSAASDDRMESGFQKLNGTLQRLQQTVEQVDSNSRLGIETNGRKIADLERMRQPLQSKLGSTYIRWGRTTCDGDATIVYKGHVAGPQYNRDGGGTNFLCLHENPQWNKYMPGVYLWAGSISGAEYEVHDDVLVFSTSNNGGRKLHGYPSPCVACFKPHTTTVMMIPARITCPPGWNLEYHGYLVSEARTTNENRHRSQYTCWDNAPEAASGLFHQHQSVLYPVQVECGTLPCAKFFTGWELTCAVCSR